MPRKQTDTREFAGEQAAVFHAAVSALEAQQMSISAADPATGAIEASTGTTMRSWGEDLSIQVTAGEPGKVGVTITSKVKLQLVDWGKNKKNIDALFGSIDAVLRGGPATLGR